jgi:hypothetical protein
VDQSTRIAYAEAALTGLRVSLLVPGVLAIVTGLIAFLALGRRDPMHSVWDYQDERSSAAAAEAKPEPAA